MIDVAVRGLARIYDRFSSQRSYLKVRQEQRSEVLFKDVTDLLIET